jgi:hypothetical protein
MQYNSLKYDVYFEECLHFYCDDIFANDFSENKKTATEGLWHFLKIIFLFFLFSCFTSVSFYSLFLHENTKNIIACKNVDRKTKTCFIIMIAIWFVEIRCLFWMLYGCLRFYYHDIFTNIFIYTFLHSTSLTYPHLPVHST